MREGGAKDFEAAVARFHKAAWTTRAVHTVRGPVEPHLFEGNASSFEAFERRWWAPRAARAAPGDAPLLRSLVVSVRGDGGGARKTLETDESFRLTVPDGGDEAAIEAATLWGAMYGLELFSQLVTYVPSDGGGAGRFAVAGVPVVVEDAPRFPWRGLLVDTANHFLPLASLLRTVDAMAASRLNVLHWHLGGSYSFPLLSDERPELARRAAWTPGDAYSAADMRALAEHARARGVRVVAELDTPGHAYSLGLAYPGVTLPCPAVVPGTDIGPVNVVPLDPTLNKTYDLVRGLLGELAGALPDAFFHAGGDELQYACWEASGRVREWLREHNTTDVRVLHARYEAEMLADVAALGRRAVVWEDTFEQVPGALPAGVVVETWDSGTTLEAVLSAGHDALLAGDFYLDRQVPFDNDTGWFWIDTWAQMYASPMNASSDDDGARGRVLGGEASMWSEQVSSMSLDARVWPRACAAAERMWSGADSANDAGLAAMRLAAHRCRLAARGVPVGPVWSDHCAADADTLEAEAPGARPHGHVYTSREVAGFVVAGALAGAALFVVFAVGCGALNDLRRGKVGADAAASGRRRGSSSSKEAAAPLLSPAAGAPRSEEALLAVGGPPPPIRRRERMQSIDVLRGLTVMLMVLVDRAGDAFPEIDHAAWNGASRLADYVEPFFDGLVGVSICLSMRSFITGSAADRRRLRGGLLRKAWWRFFRLFMLGVATQGGVAFLNYDLRRIRVMGILQRVALCYLVAVLAVLLLPEPGRHRDDSAAGDRSGAGLARLLFSRFRWTWVLSAALCLAHTGVMYGVDVPPAYGEPCGRGVLTPPCNAATYVDLAVFGETHMYFPSNGGSPDADVTFQRLPDCSSCAPGKCELVPGAPEWCLNGPFDPEGVVSTLTCVVASLVGLHLGRVLLLADGARARLVQWLPVGAAQLAAGLALHLSGAVPANMDLYSVSWLLISNGAFALALCLAYAVVDVAGRTALLQPCRWAGCNAIVFYVLAEGGIVEALLGQFYWGSRDRSLANLLFPTGVYWGASDWRTRTSPSHSPYVLLWVVGFIAAWTLVARHMFVRKIFVKI